MPTAPPSSTTPGAWTFRQFHARITRFGNAMHGLGLAKGDRIALLMPDCREYLEADYGDHGGRLRARADRPAAHAARACRAAAACRRARAGDASGVRREGRAADGRGRSRCSSIVFVGKGSGLDYEALLEKSSEQPLPDGDGDDLATLNFSGGTTGAPKAVMLRHRNLMTVAREHHPRLRHRERRGVPERAAAVADRAGDPDVASVRRRDRGAGRPLRCGSARER